MSIVRDDARSIARELGFATRPSHSSSFLTRRSFLALAAASAASAALRCPLDPDASLTLESDPFSLGVASGDPLSDRVIIWTRLAPDPLNGGGMPADPGLVLWEVAEDPDFDKVVRLGLAAAIPSLAHSVHVDVSQLRPNTTYWYRFTAGEYQSPVGRTRTLPERDASPEELRFAVASCQNYKDGYYTAYAGMVEEDLDFVLFLGDYIYESGPGNNLEDRDHIGERLETLTDYRNRWALYKTDLNLQAAHAAFPWVVTWDDHEVSNNYANLTQDLTKPIVDFKQLRADGYLAFYEHMPIRVLPPTGPDLEIHRAFEYGDLAKFHVMDTRQFRSDQRCDDEVGPPCAEIGDPDDTLLGRSQEKWLFKEMKASEAIWNVMAQQVVYTPIVVPDFLVNPDQWDGYPVARQRINDFVIDKEIPNYVVLSGDVHATGGAYISATATDGDTPVIGAEFVAQGIASAIDAAEATLIEQFAESLPHLRFFNARKRGYLRCIVRRDEWRTDFRAVRTALAPTSEMRDLASVAIAPGNLDPEDVS